jgi:hypothetical protein
LRGNRLKPFPMSRVFVACKAVPAEHSFNLPRRFVVRRWT